MSTQAPLPGENQNQAGSTQRWIEPSAGPALAALLDLGLLFTRPSTPRCCSAVDRFQGIGRNASQINNKRLNLNLDRSLYESMNPSEEGPNGYPSERVNEAEPRSLRWILSINKACNKFLESRGPRQPEPASAVERTEEKERRRFQLPAGKD